MATTFASIFLVIIATFIGAFGGLFFKLGADKLQFKIKHILKNYMLLSGIVFYVLSAVFFVIALKSGELTILFPLTSLTYVWILLLSRKFLGEKINLFKILGIVFIIIGVSLIGIGA